MTPAQLLARLDRGDLAPAYLFLGPEAYQRRRTRAAVLKAALGEGGSESAVTQYDLTEAALAVVIDDARALSLFATERVILVGNAEAGLPRTKSDDEDADGGSGAGSAAVL